MPLGSTGMFVPIPSKWGAKYVDGGPFTRFSDWFHVELAFWYLVLELEVLTGYEDISKSAVVRVNEPQLKPLGMDSRIGVIEPRPTSRYQDLQPYSIYFSAGPVVRPWNPAVGSGSGPQYLQIDPVSAFDWLVVGKWRVIYHQRTH